MPKALSPFFRHGRPQFSEVSRTLNLDYRHRGLGSGSCGPDPLKQYILRAHELPFARLYPFSTVAESPMTLSKQRFE